MTDRDDFDKIVEGLDLDLSFPDEPTDPAPTREDPQLESAPEDDDPPEIEEPFYRRVDPVPLMPRSRSVLIAWAALLCAPLALVAATMFGVFLDRAILAGAALIFVAAAIYLILQLPEHGPSRRDWPDDGAVL